jgi:hypothetical protein
MEIYLVYRTEATEVSERDRPFVADLSLMKVTDKPGGPKVVEIQTSRNGSPAIPVTFGPEGWTGQEGNFKFRAKLTTLENKNIAIGLVTYTQGVKVIIDTFFAEKIGVDLELPNGTYNLHYAWEANEELLKTLVVEQKGDQKKLTHVLFDAGSVDDKAVAQTPGPQAAGRFTTTITDVKDRLIHGWAIPFQGKTALIGHATRPGSAQDPDPTDPVEPFVAIASSGS